MLEIVKRLLAQPAEPFVKMLFVCLSACVRMLRVFLHPVTFLYDLPFSRYRPAKSPQFWELPKFRYISAAATESANDDMDFIFNSLVDPMKALYQQ